MSGVILDPLVPMPVLWGLVALALGIGGLARWRRMSGWGLRALAALALVAGIANPSLQHEERQGLSDIVLLIVDESASQSLPDRAAQTARARASVEAEIAALPNTELRVITVTDGAEDHGTLLMTALTQAMSEEPRTRLAGAILLTDGQLHDLELTPDFPAPVHALLTGQPDDWDRRLVITSAPAFAILDEEIELGLRIEDQGAAPAPPGSMTTIDIAVDGGPPQTFSVPTGRDLQLPLTLTHGGINVLQFSTPVADGELTDRNNAAVVQINGVRDRLRVLLVSGEPHAGERTWRNLLKSDSAVDLVHFTILRPPEKQDGVPTSELSLIAFPTRELFMEKIDEFDLIIFDRYKRRGILPTLYLDNIRDYIEGGGAVLFASGPDFASADSLYRSPLGTVMPAAPTGLVREEGFRPEISELGRRHPVTEGLAELAPETGWGRWFRQVELTDVTGEAVMTGLDGAPLLVLDRVGEGRVALLASDQAWLWSRGFEGGGPQLELLRRLAHWSMKEPALEEEALTATAEGQVMTITRRTLSEGARDVTVTGPDGTAQTLPMDEVAPGRFEATVQGWGIGLYRLSEGEMSSVIALGPRAPREFEQTIASGDLIEPMSDATRGGIMAISAGLPDIRTVREGRPAAGRGWIGITPRGAYLTTDLTVTPVLPAWLWLVLAAMLIVGAWLIEGRGTRRA